MDWSASATPNDGFNLEYVRTIRVKQIISTQRQPDGFHCGDCPYSVPAEYSSSPPKSQIQMVAASHPGMTWIVGNEMELRDWGACALCGQDEMLPELYAWRITICTA